jgi:hypothetical protein
MPDPATTPVTLDIDSRHGYAMVLMVLGSVAISFGGLVLRSIEVANPWQINVYRSLGLIVAIAAILAIQNRGRFFATLLSVGRFGLLAGVLLAGAGLSFIQAFAHTTIANALFIIGAIPFFAALLARLFLGQRARTDGRQRHQYRFRFRQPDGAGDRLVLRRLRGRGALSAPGRNAAVAVDLGGAGHRRVAAGDRRRSHATDERHIAVPVLGRLPVRFAEVTLLMLIEFALGPVWVWLFVNEVPSRWTLIGGSVIIVSVAVRAILELMNKSRPEQTPVQPV